ncbi:uncharacterized protein TrAtP1_007549 [Trichoderma atroviride]|uniref:uncharacterized protein n=1 Tax=Hypocrea atroviridis TaxID=63577 RepID=UPI00332BB682|nr:hypothetical protein TrAtP1_007549 [Trichoderma atroviride]
MGLKEALLLEPVNIELPFLIEFTLPSDSVLVYRKDIAPAIAAKKLARKAISTDNPQP